MKRKIIESTPLIILWITVFYSCLIIGITQIIFSNELYWGIAILIFSTIIWIISKKYGKLFLALALFLSAFFSIIAFTPTIINRDVGVTMGVIKMGVKFQPYSLYVLIILIAANWSVVKKAGKWILNNLIWY